MLWLWLMEAGGGDVCHFAGDLNAQALGRNFVIAIEETAAAAAAAAAATTTPTSNR
jgi:hypothetical protein